MARKVHFVVKPDDKETLTAITDACKDSIDPKIVYHGKVIFRDKTKFPIFSEEPLVYKIPVKEYGTLKSLYNTSVILQKRLILSPHPLVGCIGTGIKSIIVPSASNLIDRVLIVFADCPTIRRCIKAFNKPFSTTTEIKCCSSVKQIIHELRNV